MYNDFGPPEMPVVKCDDCEYFRAVLNEPYDGHCGSGGTRIWCPAYGSDVTDGQNVNERWHLYDNERNQYKCMKFRLRDELSGTYVSKRTATMLTELEKLRSDARRAVVPNELGEVMCSRCKHSCPSKIYPEHRIYKEHMIYCGLKGHEHGEEHWERYAWWKCTGFAPKRKRRTPR